MTKKRRFTFLSVNFVDVGYIKSIGLTLDDILRDELRENMTLKDQSVSIKISVALTIIMFVGGLVNSILSLITFQNKQCQQVGCGLYLLASSVTSFLTISMFTIKFWFVVLTQINVSASLSVLRGGCVSLEVILKFCLYSDGWLNACVAIERAANVVQGINFDKKKSRYYAKQVILFYHFSLLVLLHMNFISQITRLSAKYRRDECWDSRAIYLMCDSLHSCCSRLQYSYSVFSSFSSVSY